ncbi:DUF3141 domain-containing protein [Ornithinicoccus hortensis]|uniref:Uncharacterized protein DUF3141 n=1 Tax=Ornithinicoccus hortensis TaxID=82346 RepID=A0A542YTG5_9MICO|nr:DUF3141 domain-containing protein [Ornithinicoccus hortensis]TQL51379.1 uncharacterized protein DUF3141 [Ornithinicoccus hortensis]
MTATTSSSRNSTGPIELAFEPIVGAYLEHVREPQLSRWAFAPFDAMTAITTGWVDYLTRAVERRATPLDLAHDALEWWQAVHTKVEPTWSTPFRVEREWATARLLDFSDADTAMVPTVILPPQAGHASTIVDYTQTQSQVRTALQNGLDRLYVLEWKGATEETKDTTIEDYITILDDTAAALGGKINLVGDCQGGWLAAIYAALRPGVVNSLAIGAAPIDFHAGYSAIRDWTEAFRATGELAAYRGMVALGGGVYRGQNQVTGFKMLEPAGQVQRQMDLWAHIDDPDFVQRYRDFVTWFEWDQDMAGTFYLWVVEHLFMNNELVKGTLRVAGETVDLGKITVPLYLLAGTNDHITPPEQVWALVEHANTPAQDVHSRLLEAGHLGLFMGRQALREHWGPIFGDIRTISRVEPRKTAAPKTEDEPAATPAKRTTTAAKPKATRKAAPAKRKATPAKRTAAATTTSRATSEPKAATSKVATAKAEEKVTKPRATKRSTAAVKPPAKAATPKPTTAQAEPKDTAPKTTTGQAAKRSTVASTPPAKAADTPVADTPKSTDTPD